MIVLLFADNAISSVVALGVSYAMPVAVNVLQGRRKLPAARSFILPEWFAWFANLLGIAYVLLTTVLFVFPPELPVTANNMNYCIVAFGIVLIVSVIQWFIDGRKNYHGPKIDIDSRILEAMESPPDELLPDSSAANGTSPPMKQTDSNKINGTNGIGHHQSNGIDKDHYGPGEGVEID